MLPYYYRMALLSYSLVHCTDDMIEEVLVKRMALKNEILLSRIEATSKRGRSSSPQADKVDSESPNAEGEGESKVSFR